MPSVTVRVPATSANLGAGFDCLGVALDLWGRVTLEDAGRTEDAMSRMALTAAESLFKRIGSSPPDGLSAAYGGDLPVARGLGASAVARAGGLTAANAMAGDPLDREEIAALASELEGHADNATPAIFGGFQVSVLEEGRVLHTGVPLPRGLAAVLFVPEMTMPTRESRKALPESLSRADAVHQIGRAALMVAAMARGRFDLLDAATQDRLHQPARLQLFPAMFAIFDAAKEAGAHCAYLSGGGSSICALATANHEKIAEAMRRAAHERETPGETLITKPTERGAEVVEKE